MHSEAEGQEQGQERAQERAQEPDRESSGQEDEEQQAPAAGEVAANSEYPEYLKYPKYPFLAKSTTWEEQMVKTDGANRGIEKITCGELGILKTDYLDRLLLNAELWDKSPSKLAHNFALAFRQDKLINFTGIIQPPSGAPLFSERRWTVGALDYYPSFGTLHVGLLAHSPSFAGRFNLSDKTLTNLRTLRIQCVRLAKQFKARKNGAGVPAANATAGGNLTMKNCNFHGGGQMVISHGDSSP